MDPIITLLVVLVAMLTILVGVFLGMLIVVLLTLKKTLERLQRAIDTVEDTALRSLAPFLSLRAMFSNTHGFMNAISSVVTGLKKKRPNS
jgi:NhaP-type Na+/H+ or K+/H+ antiporter